MSKWVAAGMAIIIAATIIAVAPGKAGPLKAQLPAPPITPEALPPSGMTGTPWSAGHEGGDSQNGQGAKMPARHFAEWVKGTEARLQKLKNVTGTGGDVDKLTTLAADLIAQVKAGREQIAKAGDTAAAGGAQDKYFRMGRQLIAAGAVMDAADRLVMVRDLAASPEAGDFWGAGFILQGCYFRVRQADYFANISGDKNSWQYVKLASSMYQQGRSAYDAKEYRRARFLGDASASVVFALECLAQAATPNPHIYK